MRKALRTTATTVPKSAEVVLAHHDDGPTGLPEHALAASSRGRPDQVRGTPRRRTRRRRSWSGQARSSRNVHPSTRVSGWLHTGRGNPSCAPAGPAPMTLEGIRHRGRARAALLRATLNAPPTTAPRDHARSTRTTDASLRAEDGRRPSRPRPSYDTERRTVDPGARGHRNRRHPPRTVRCSLGSSSRRPRTTDGSADAYPSRERGDQRTPGHQPQSRIRSAGRSDHQVGGGKVACDCKPVRSTVYGAPAASRRWVSEDVHRGRVRRGVG